MSNSSNNLLFTGDHSANASELVNNTATEDNNNSSLSRNDSSASVGTHTEKTDVTSSVSNNVREEARPKLSKEEEELRRQRFQRRKSVIVLFAEKLAPKFSEEDHLKLNPIDKMIKYRKIPFKMLIDMALCVLIILMIFFMGKFRSPYQIYSGFAFEKDFLPAGFETAATNIDGRATYYFNDKHDLISWLEKLVSDYYNYVNDNVDTYEFGKGAQVKSTVTAASSTVKEVPQEKLSRKKTTSNPSAALKKVFKFSATKLQSTDDSPTEQPTIGIPHRVTLLKENLRSYIAYSNDSKIANFKQGIPALLRVPEFEHFEEILTLENPLGNFYKAEKLEQGDFFEKLYRSEMELELYAYDISEPISKRPECKRWVLTFVLDFKERFGTLPLTIEYNSYDCDIKYTPMTAKFTRLATWFAVAVLALSIISFALISKAMAERFAIFLKSRKQNRKAIPLSHFLRYVTLWHILSVLKDIFCILGSFIIILPRFVAPNEVEYIQNLSVGLGALFSCTAIMRYYQFTPKLYILIITLRVALPVIIRFLLSIIPIALAFSVAGTLWFGHYSHYFDSLSETFVTLFCLMYQDEMRKIYDMLYAYSIWTKYLSRIYLFLHTMLFVYAVFAICLLITEESYFSIWDGTKSSAELAESISNIEGTSGLFYFQIKQQDEQSKAKEEKSASKVAVLDDDENGDELVHLMDDDIKNIPDEDAEETETDYDDSSIGTYGNNTSDPEAKRDNSKEKYVSLVTDCIMEQVKFGNKGKLSSKQLACISNIDMLAKQLLKNQA